MAQLTYLDEYGAFMDNYKSGEVSGEEVGEKIARLAQYFAMFNLEYAMAEHERAKVAAALESKVDENGKQISSSKAQVLAEATTEAAAARKAKVHIQNLEQMLNALKSLQKGLLQEYSHVGNI